MDALEKLALWIGWAPIAFIEFLFMIVAKFFYDRELANKDVTIQQLQFNIDQLNRELENSKQYRVDVLIQNLTQRVQVLNKELENLNAEKETEKRRGETIEQEKESVVSQLKDALSEIFNLREQLKSYEENLSVTTGHILEIFSREFILPKEIDEVNEYLEKIYESLSFEANKIYKNYYKQEQIKKVIDRIQEFRRICLSGTGQTDSERKRILYDLQSLFHD